MLATLLAGSGCVAQPIGVNPTPRGWFAARGMDLTDIVSIRVALGPGLLAHARITRFIALGAGELGSVAATRPGFTLDHYQFGWIKREGGLWTERRVELGVSTLYLFEAEGESLAGDRATFGPRARRPLDIGVDLHLALIGVAAEVRVDEVFDFLAGLVGADPQVDDAEGMPISTPFEGGAADE
ncbi:MAG: hypothetical protein IPH13_05765 [Planctomycetes bacterium]|nr:hypothetical protein [Planctomycetota bacterium]MCC7171283.1 hypothetical protein [Planctomycetota bacterium]